MTNKAKETFKNVTLTMAYERGFEVEELKMYALKETWLKGLEGEALDAFKQGVRDQEVRVNNAKILFDEIINSGILDRD